MPSVFIKKRARIFKGHDWVYSSEIQNLTGNPEAGDVVELYDLKKNFLGNGIYNPKSTIQIRRFSRHKHKLDNKFFESRISRAISYRKKIYNNDLPELCRLIWSEADGLPGIVLDKYNNNYVLQVLTLGFYLNLEQIIETLKKLLQIETLILKNDSSTLLNEGIEIQKKILIGNEKTQVEINIENIKLSCDLLDNQKTGFYLDQLPHYKTITNYIDGHKVLDCFSNQGAFAIFSLLHKNKEYSRFKPAQKAYCVDISEKAIQIGEENIKKNNLTKKNINFHCANAFDFLKKISLKYSNNKSSKHDKENNISNDSRDIDFRPDFIILDPPSFTKNKKSLNGALRGYKEIHLRALQILEHGSILVTFCCSYHISSEIFLEIILKAALDAKKNLIILEKLEQSKDHPRLLNIPETEYFKGFIFEVTSAF